MRKPVPSKEGISDKNVQSLIVDGCKVTLRFAEQSQPGTLDGIRRILTSSISAQTQADFLQK